MEAGGWQVMKRARMLVDGGRVLDVRYDGKLVKGTVVEGKRNLGSGMLIRGRTDVENLCGCAEARRSGILCAHALALGLAVARGQSASAGKRAASSSEKQPPNKSPSTTAFSPPQGPLTFRFPKNFPQAFARGSVGAQIEVATEGEDAADLPVLAWLQSLGESKVPPHLLLNAEQAAGLFRALTNHPRVFLEKEPLPIESAPLRIPLKLEPEGGDRVRLTLEKPAGLPLMPHPGGVWAYLPERSVLLPAVKLDAIPKTERGVLLEKLTRDQPVIQSWKWFFQHAEALENAFRFDVKGLPKMPRIQQVRPRFQLKIEGSLNHLAATLSCVYGDLSVRPGDLSAEIQEAFPYATAEAPWEWNDRHLLAEKRALERLDAAGFSEPDRNGQQTLRTENAILKFFASVLPKWQCDWDVTIGERFQHVTRDIERVQPEMRTVPHAEGGWLDIDIGYATTSDQSLPRHEIQRLLQVGQSHTKLKNGRRVVIDLEACEEINQALQDADPEQAHGRYRISADQEDFLRATIGEFANREVGAIPQAPFPDKELADLASILRDYQKEGVCWMLARTGRGLSGILADEMGLGKTLQSLAVIQALHAQSEEEKPQSLVVCPTSLLDNWCAEAARFTPDLKVLKLHGPKRAALWKKASQHDLLVTSYGLLVRDLEQIQELDLLGAFLDEASAIKSATTKNAKAACALKARYRFALTGTPIENSVRDIWSIMQFVAPGYLGGQKVFRERYELPLANERGAPQAVKDRLRRRLQPFILRRTKKRVATELPDRIEKVLTCALTEQQRNVYTDLLRAGRERVLDARGQGEGAARMSMLTTLLRLRQVCCDLRLLGSQDEERSTAQASAKLGAVEELLQEAQEGGHRVLIFSQFVSMLALLRESLESQNIVYCYLDGQTQNRHQQVTTFQKGETPVFLISLKAGGYGLNLTAADTVIHFDPWWNPAVEAQATDRAHRIGQQNVVTSYKLIAQDTVEEKILRLQRRKREVIDAALDDEQPLMQGLTTGDLEDLLEFG